MAPTFDLVATVPAGGPAGQLQFAPAQVHVAGAFAGNVVVVVSPRPAMPPKALVAALRLTIGADVEMQAPMAYDPFADGSLELTFHSAQVLQCSPLPDEVTVWWQSPRTELIRIPLQIASE